MAKSANPRVNLTIPQETYDVLKEYSDLHGNKIGTEITNFLIESKPIFMMAIESIKLAETDKQKAIDLLQLKVNQSSIDTLQMMIDLNLKND
jgi:hypothetical protein